MYTDFKIRSFEIERKCLYFQSAETNSPEYISQAITILGELLARGSSLGTTYLTEEAEAAALAAILEVKVSVCFFVIVECKYLM